jgi:protease PrsW
VNSMANRPSSLAGSPVEKPVVGIPVFVGLALIFGAGLFVLTQEVMHRPDLWGVLLTGLILAIAASIPAVVLVIYLDRREPEPWWLLVIAFLWGALIATGLAIVLEGWAGEGLAAVFDESAGLVDTSQLGYQFQSPQELFTWLERAMIAPLVEEGLKAFALILLFLLLPTEANSMRDGIVYGALVGLGFAVVESAAFITTGYASTGSAEYLGQLIPRFVLFGVNGHPLYSALFGAALGWARQSTSYGKVRKGLIIGGGFLLALAGHAMSNAFGPFALAAFASVSGAEGTVTAAQLWLLDLVTVLATNGWVYLVVGYLATRSGYWELEICRSELAAERPPVITPDEYSLVKKEGLWRLRRFPGLSRRQSAQLVRAQNELAFRRHDVRRAGADPVSDHLVEQWRAAISELRERGV